MHIHYSKLPGRKTRNVLSAMFSHFLQGVSLIGVVLAKGCVILAEGVRCETECPSLFLGSLYHLEQSVEMFGPILGPFPHQGRRIRLVQLPTQDTKEGYKIQ